MVWVRMGLVVGRPLDEFRHPRLRRKLATMSDLPEFLLARIADLEALARAVQDEKLSPSAPIDTGDDPWPSERVFAEYVTPARVLAECEAKRRIVERADQTACSDARCGSCSQHTWAGQVLQLLALPYADHPDFDESWRP